MAHDDYNDRVEDYQRVQDGKREELALKYKRELNQEFECLVQKSVRTENEIARLRKEQKNSFNTNQEEKGWRNRMIKSLQAAPQDRQLAFFRSECRSLATKIINDDNLLAVASVEAPGTLARLQLFFPNVKKTLNNLASQVRTYRPKTIGLMNQAAKEQAKSASIFLELAIDLLMISVEAYEN